MGEAVRTTVPSANLDTTTEPAPIHRQLTPPMPANILLIQLRRIGDVLMTTPAVAALRQAYPAAHLAYLTERPSDEVFRHSPHLDEVILYPPRPSLGQHLAMLARMRRRRFDLVVDFFGNPRSAQLAWASGAPRRIGFRFRWRRWAYTDAVIPPAGLHYAAAHKAALLAPLGVAVGSLRPQVYVGEEERAYARRQLAELGVAEGDFLVALCPVSRQPYKVWPAQNFARLADALIERRGAKVLCFWGPGEYHFIQAVRAHMRHETLGDYPVPTLQQMTALLERARLYVGNDNGPRHFAIAVGTPSVAVFGRPFPQSWTPPGEPLHRTLEYDPGCKAACTYPRCDHLACINQVPLEAVLRETLALVATLDRHPLERHGTAPARKPGPS
ncbi:MAG: glycosyltransferase family 9 protein [Candidatus Lambdaproteobacteria bacterium]|nr:glycosyltransferase family 9 protein [Candidatus Lambdaproteobacteria bacterium]